MGFLNELQSHQFRAWKSMCLNMSFAVLGLHSAVFGPSLIDLQHQVGTTIDQITSILPTRAFGSMVGSTLCGFALSYFDHQVVLLACSFVMSASIFCVPLCSQFWELFIVMLINGLAYGFLVNAGNCFVIHCWGTENSPFMQIAHFSFGIGAFVSPFIVEPFLTEWPDIDNSELSIISGSSIYNASNTTNPQQHTESVFPNLNNSIPLKWAYFMIGAIGLIVWVAFFLTYLKKPGNKEHSSRQMDKKMVEIKNLEKSSEMVNFETTNIRPYHKYVIVLFSALFIHFAYGLELTFGTMLASYARLSELHMDKASASYITSLCTIVLINFISARTMLYIDLILIMLSNVVLLPFLFMDVHYESLLWIGAALMGIGSSSLYPTLWSFLEEIVPVTSKMTSSINSCACVGEFILPVLIGKFIENWPNIFITMVFIYSSLAFIVFTLAVIWECVIDRYKKSQNSMITLPNYNET